jgi:hypothetical protein
VAEVKRSPQQCEFAVDGRSCSALLLALVYILLQLRRGGVVDTHSLKKRREV